MGDRSHARITIGGAVTKKNWRKIAEELESWFGDEFALPVLRGDKEMPKSADKLTAAQLVAAHARLSAAWKAGAGSPEAVTRGVPIAKLGRLAGAVLTFEADEVSGGRFDDLQAMLREANLHYLVHSDGYQGSWPIADTWWAPDDAHRGAEGWGPFYNTFGERYVEYIDGDRNVRPAMDEEQIRAAFAIARAELSKADLPPGPDYGDELLRRTIEIGTKLPAIPPISILEK